MDYGHLFLGTNDFEGDFMNLDTLIQEENLPKASTVYVVSNGWMFIVDSLFKNSIF